ncbi:GlsB/YeaQ/YmgE family stress response membrane protein [Bartonella sp. B17]
MEDVNIGWITAIILGGLVGWGAKYFTKNQTKVFLNIVLGIIGAAFANFLSGFFSIHFAGWLSYPVLGLIGSCIFIYIGHLFVY